MTTFDLHGGPDADGVPLYDFSTNANASGPCPSALEAVQRSDATRYPDPTYTALRHQLAGLHGVAPERVMLAASASEFIQRITAVTAALHPGARYAVPRHHYGDYASAAEAWGLQRTVDARQADLYWACEPSSPMGQGQAGLADAVSAARVTVLDCAYAPLRLSGTASLDDALRDQVWQLWTPNKALGLTGVRGAYAIAPAGRDPGQQQAVDRFQAALQARCPSWPVGADGVALLQAWCQPETLAWLHASLDVLRDWKTRQWALLGAMGWICLPSDTSFFCARPDVADVPQALGQLRAQGIKLRDADAFGLPGHVRLAVLAPDAQDALLQAWSALKASTLLADTLRSIGHRPAAPLARSPWPEEPEIPDAQLEIDYEH